MHLLMMLTCFNYIVFKKKWFTKYRGVTVGIRAYVRIPVTVGRFSSPWAFPNGFSNSFPNDFPNGSRNDFLLHLHALRVAWH